MNKTKKYFSSFILILTVFIIASLACQVFSPSGDEKPEDYNDPVTWPDLTLTGSASMPITGTCLEEYLPLESEVCVRNQGGSPAGYFSIETGKNLGWTVDALAVGEEFCFKTNVDLSGALIVVDFDNEVNESDESNNNLMIPIPTPPVLCTPETGENPTQEESSQTEPESLPDVSYQGVSFSYDDALANAIETKTAPSETDGGIPEWNSPEHIQFDLVGYPLAEAFHSPRILVFSVADFTTVNPRVADIVSQLQQLLTDQPSNPETIPFLPIFNAGQMMQAKVKYLDFQNGSGVRFVTQYGQAAWPINGNDMFYTFQGLTHDGQYYISAILPVSHPSLPDPDSVTLDDDFYNNFMEYVDTVEIQLSGESDGTFSPSFELLDALIRSILVENP